MLADKEAPAGPRGRVARHMKAMLAAGAALTASACERGPMGPIVCDPLPPPLECQNDPETLEYVSRPLHFAAAWRETEPGFALDVSLSYQDVTEYDDPVAFPYDPQATGATVGKVERDRRGLYFQLVPAEGVPWIDLTIPVDCSGRDDALYLRLDVSAPPRAGESVHWSTNEP